MKIKISDYEVTMNSGRIYTAAELLTPKDPSGQRNIFDTIVIFYNGTMVGDDDIGGPSFEMVDWMWGASGLTVDEIWGFLIETAEADDKRREQEGR